MMNTEIEKLEGKYERLKGRYKKLQKEVDDEISKWLSRLILKGAGLVAVGFLIGRFAK